MEELSIEEKAKAYDEALEKARGEYAKFEGMPQGNVLEDVFPELKESEDERIRKMIINTLNRDKILTEDESYDCVTWLEKKGESFTKKDVDDAYLKGVCDAKKELEKQGEKKHTDKVEPKFEVGDWVIYCGKTYQITGLHNDTFTLTSCDGSYFFNNVKSTKEPVFHLWTIQDAKDGDVLAYVTDEEDLWIMIYQSLYEHYEGHVHYHALIVNDNFSDKGTCCICIDGLKPATKEQRDTLMKAMADAEYTFDFEKKELKKIEQKPAEWGEEDEKMLNLIIARLHSHPNVDIEEYSKEYDWLNYGFKSLRPQKNNWERVTKEIYFKEPVLVRRKDKSDSWEGYRVCNDYTLNPQTDECYIRIKDITNQKQWKPSEEHLDALNNMKFAVQHFGPSASLAALDDLYNQLKKLTE